MVKINYNRLASFQFDQPYQKYNDEKIEIIINENDFLLNEFLNNKINKNNFVSKIKKNSINIKNILFSSIHGNDILCSWINNIIDLSEIIFLNEQLLFLNSAKKIHSNDEYISYHANILKKDGLTKIEFDESDLVRLNNFIKNIPFDQQLNNRFIPNKFNLFYNNLIRKYKIGKIAKYYVGMKMFAHPKYTIRFVENHDPKIWSSLNGTITHDLDTLHLDRFLPSITLLIYLSDVSSNDGPFQYIKGSSQYEQSIFTRCIHTGVSYSTFPGTNKEYDYEDYKHRKTFMKLPKIFQGHLIIGSFINRDSNNYNILKKTHIKAIGKAGSAFLFDGYHTLHTGGRPLNGHRHTLFQGFTPYYKIFKRLNY